MKPRKIKYLYECNWLKNHDCIKQDCILNGTLHDECFTTIVREYRLKGGRRINALKLHGGSKYELEKYEMLRKSARERYEIERSFL